MLVGAGVIEPYCNMVLARTVHRNDLCIAVRMMTVVMTVTRSGTRSI